MEYGEHCGIAKQVEGKVVDAELGKDNLWHWLSQMRNRPIKLLKSSS